MTETPPTPPPSPRTLRSIVRVVSVGAAAGSSSRFADNLGVAASARPRPPVGAVTPVALPWGVWPADGADTVTPAGLDPTLARYAAALRQRRAPRRTTPRRGLPILARRAGATQRGTHRGPGGLARSLVGQEQPVAPIVGGPRRGRPATSQGRR